MASPTLNLAPDVQNRYSQAMADPTIANNPQAVQYVTQQAQQQSQQEQSVPATPSLNPKPQNFFQKAGSFIKNNLPAIGGTLGMVGTDALGALLAPETGGLSLAAAIPLGASLAAGGSAAGKAAQNKLNGQKITSGLGGAAVEGAIGGAGGPLVGKALEGVTGLVGNKLIGEGEDAAVKSIGLSQANRNNFYKGTGQTVSDFLKEHNLAGEGADSVKAAQDNLQTQYNNIARNSGIKVPQSTVRQDLLASLGGSDLVTPQGENAADTSWETMKSILKNLPTDKEGNIDIADLTNAKSKMQAQTNFDATRPGATQQANETISNSLMGTINKAADEAGLTAGDGKSLSQLGQSLNKFKQLNNLIASKEPGQAGTGTLTKIISHAIVPAVGTTAGAAIGGITGGVSGAEKGAGIGASLGGLSEGLLNSPAVLSKLATLLPSIGEKLSPQVGDLVAKAGLTGDEAASATLGPRVSTPQSVARTVPGRFVANSAIDAIGNSVNPPATPNLSANSQNNGAGQGVPTTPDLTPASSGNNLQDGITALKSGQPLSTAQYTALMSVVGINPKLSSYVTNAYQASNPASTQGLGIASNAANTLGDLYSTAGGAQGPITGNIESALGRTGLSNQSVQAYNKQSQALGQEIISQIYGSSGTASDRDQVFNLIPQISDSATVAASKMSTLRALINQRLSSIQGATPTSVSASNTPSLAGATP